MRVCVLGAGGLIGRHLCSELLSHGYDVVGVTAYSQRPPDLGGAQWVNGVSRVLRSFLLAEAQWDVVFDLRAYRGEDVSELAAIGPSVANHWVHISTVYVYRRLSEALEMPDDSPFLPIPIEESTPCAPSGVYGTGKLECEVVWHSCTPGTFPLTIVRLPFVYGCFDRSLRIRFYLDHLIRGEEIKLPSGGMRRVDLLYAGDLVRVLLALAQRTPSGHQTYNVAVSPALPLRRHIETMATILGVPAAISTRSPSEREGELAPFAYPVDLVLECSRLRAFLGEMIPTPLTETWRKAIEWELRYVGVGA